MKLFLNLSFFSFILCCASASWADEVVTSTEHFDIYFDDEEFIGDHGDAFIQYVREMSEQSYRELSSKTGLTLTQKVAVNVLSDFDRFNASATPTFDWQIQLYATSPLFGVFHENGQLLKDVFTHELAHILQMTRKSGISEFLVENLGNNPAYMPNTFVPLFMLEGFAQHMEIDAEFSSGRGHHNNPWYEAMWLAEVQRGFESYNQVAQAKTSKDHGLAYLYGAYFYAYLGERFSQEKITQFFDRRGNAFNHALGFDFFYLNGAWSDVFDEDINQTWAQFLASETQRLEKVSADQNDSHQYGTSSQVLNFYVDEHSLIFSHSDGLTATEVYNEQSQILDGYYPNSIHSRANGDRVFTQAGSCGGQDFTSLYLSINDDVNEILPCARIRYAVLHPTDNLIAVLRQGAAEQFVELYEFDHAGEVLLENKNTDEEKPKAIKLDYANYTQSYSDLAFSPDGSQLLINKKDNDYWNLKSIPLNDEMKLKEAPLMSVTSDKAVRLFVQWLDDQTLIYSKDIGSQLQVFVGTVLDGRLDTANEQQLTHDPFNAYRAFVRTTQAGQTLYYLSQNALGDGYSIKTMPFNKMQPIVASAPTLETESNDSVPASKSISKGAQFTKRPYRVLDTLGIDTIMPSFLWNNNQLRLGISASATDVSQRHQYDVSLVGDLLDGQTRMAFDYHYGALLSFNTALSDYAVSETVGLNTTEHKGIMSGAKLGLQLPIELSESSLTFAASMDVQRFQLFDQSKVSVNNRFILTAEYTALNTYAKAMAAHGYSMAVLAEFERNDHQYQPEEERKDIPYIKNYRAQSYFSYPVFGSDYMTLSSAVNYSTSNFDVNGSSSARLYAPLINKHLNLHGFEAVESLSNKVFQVDLDYHIPIAHPSRSIGSSLFAVERFVLSPSVSVLGNWSFDNIETDLKQSKANAALEIQTDITIAFNVPLSLNLGYANMITDVEGDYPGAVYFKVESRR